MARATEAEVLAIMDTTMTDEQITPHLTAANLLVTDILSGEGYGDDRMREIERWLAAHFAEAFDPSIAHERIGDAAATYKGKTGLGLSSTDYGQRAMLLDSHGKLAQLSQVKRPARITALEVDVD